MTNQSSYYPELEDYIEILLRLIASPLRKPSPTIEGSECLPGIQPGDVLVLVGETRGHLAGSLYVREWLDGDAVELAQQELLPHEAEKENENFIRSVINKRMANAISKVGDGGLAISAAEMALTTGVSLSVTGPDVGSPFIELLAERRGSYLMALPFLGSHRLLGLAKHSGIDTNVCGLAGLGGREAEISFSESDGDPIFSLPLSQLRDVLEI